MQFEIPVTTQLTNPVSKSKSLGRWTANANEHILVYPTSELARALWTPQFNRTFHEQNSKQLNYAWLWKLNDTEASMFPQVSYMFKPAKKEHLSIESYWSANSKMINWITSLWKGCNTSASKKWLTNRNKETCVTWLLVQ